ncbi:MAG: PQQ-binding-like beta-propeller repeat protein [Bacteroidetes bacterium]|nr:PQQ-binding-like beta-propeller repeat protein [Bacteroidota bacterium]
MKYLLIISFVSLAALNSCKTKSTEIGGYAMFRGDARHSGIYPSGEVSDKPHLKWRFKTNGYVNSSPAIEGDHIYFGSADSNLYCLDIKTGSLLWKFTTGGAVGSSPAIESGTVYFGSHDGKFYALNAADGTVKWTFDTPGEKLYSGKNLHGMEPKDSVFVDRWDFWLSSPVVYHGKVYFGSGSGYFYALDALSGKEVWKFKTGGIIHSSPAIAFGNVYFGGWDTYMHALNAESGAEIWKFKTGVDTVIHNQTGITGSAMIADSMLYFGCRDSYLYALNALTGKLAWKKYNDGGWVSVTPVVSGDKLIYSSGSSTLFGALNKKTGDSIYKQNLGTATFASPSIAGNAVYQGTFSGTMIALDVNSGKTLWTFEVEAVKQDKYGILNPDHTVNEKKELAIKEKSGGKIRGIDFGLSLGAVLSSPVIKDKVIYFGSSDGKFYALE